MFEIHAGHGQRRKPYHNIYLPYGVSLHELAVRLSESRNLLDAKVDDICNKCSKGGDLLWCNLCPRAYHIACLKLPRRPAGKWLCKHCRLMHKREKAVSYNKNAIAAGRVKGSNQAEQLFRRCFRFIENGGCVFCRSRLSTNVGFGPDTVILCDQCEKEHHVRCLKENEKCDLKELPKEDWFCSENCSTIHAALYEVVDRGAIQLPDIEAALIRKKGSSKGADIRWSLLSGKHGGSQGEIFKALRVFQEAFRPIVHEEGGQDHIRAMVCGRRISEFDYRGMYCAVLTVSSFVKSSIIIRILGRELAEVPLVATSKKGRRRGYFRALFSCIEQLLASLKVQQLVVQSTEVTKSFWINKFGFSEIQMAELQKYSVGLNVTRLDDTSLLHKLIQPTDSHSVPVCI